MIHILLSCTLIYSCGIYSFTGASIPHDAKTVSVSYFTNTATNSPSSLNQTMTEGLKDLFVSQTNLYLADNQADLSFTGEITKYQISPIAIQANETAGKNRLTISVKVKYNNKIDSQQNFENTFSRYQDFNNTENLAEIESNLIEGISNELIEDIFNKAFVNW